MTQLGHPGFRKDANGNQRTQQVFSAGSTYSYTYDAIGQLTFGDSANAGEDRRYVYDAAWNLNYRTNNTTLNSFKVDTKNQLTNATPVGTQAYDGNGNVTSSQSGSQTFSYDDENRLMTNELAYTTRSVFTYDGLGRLRQRQEYAWAGTPYFYWYVTETVRYVYDGMRVIQERNDSSTPTVSYTRGNDLSGSLEGAGGIGGLLARSHGYSSGTGNWSTHNCYHADGNGNITYLVNSSQTLAASYRYDPYGNTISSSGSLASANVYRFSSKEIHVNSGLYYYGYRWYHPNLQRWPNRDPLGEAQRLEVFLSEIASMTFPVNGRLRPFESLHTGNLYEFVLNDPIGKADLLGLDVCNKLIMEAIRLGNLPESRINKAKLAALWMIISQLCFDPPTTPLNHPTFGEVERCQKFDPSWNLGYTPPTPAQATCTGIGVGGIIAIILIPWPGNPLYCGL